MKAIYGIKYNEFRKVWDLLKQYIPEDKIENEALYMGYWLESIMVTRQRIYLNINGETYTYLFGRDKEIIAVVEYCRYKDCYNVYDYTDDKLPPASLNYSLVCQLLGKAQFYMPIDATDSLRFISNEEEFEVAKERLAKYGNVQVVIDPGKEWHSQVKIVSENWRRDYLAYLDHKGEMIQEFGNTN